MDLLSGTRGLLGAPALITVLATVFLVLPSELPRRIAVEADDAPGRQPGGSLFEAADEALPGVSWGSVDLADVDGDGDPDLLLTGYSEDQWREPIAHLYLNDGEGHFTRAEAGLRPAGNSSAAIADVDGDGEADLLIQGKSTGRPYGSKESIHSTLYLNEGSGDFRRVESGLPDLWRGSLTLADFDGDGDPDAYVTGILDKEPDATLRDKRGSVYLNDGSGRFQVADTTLSDVTSSGADAGDVDGDGDLDLVAGGRQGRIFSDDDGVKRRLRGPIARLYFNDGAARFTRWFQPPEGTLAYEKRTAFMELAESSLDLGDVDGDGDPDLLITGFPGGSDDAESLLYLNEPPQGDESPFSPAHAGLVGVRGGEGRIADLDADGDGDLLVVGKHPGPGWADTAVAYFQNERGAFEPVPTGVAGGDRARFDLGDVDGDGDLDLVVSGDVHVPVDTVRDDANRGWVEAEGSYRTVLYLNTTR